MTGSRPRPATTGPAYGWVGAPVSAPRHRRPRSFEPFFPLSYGTAALANVPGTSSFWGSGTVSAGCGEVMIQ